MPTSLRLIPIVVLLLVTSGADKVQAEAVCSDTLTAGQWIACTEAATFMDNIDIDLQSGVNITTTGESEHGILGSHKGVGDITINVNGAQDNKTITTEGVRAHGVSALSEGKGSVNTPLPTLTSLRPVKGQPDNPPMESRLNSIFSLAGNLPIPAPTMSKSR